MSSWVRDKFEHLSKWREYAKAIADSAREFDPGVKVYVFGGVAEDRITVLSDIDILIIFPRLLSDRDIIRLRREILVRAMDEHSLPFDSPVELHVVDSERAKEYLSRARKLIEIT
ncbi:MULTISPECIES: nucleotidyltransferase domain-containing protein [Metallosphaera]|uniref:nucleotidyltransferase domain-containing protein n=1 Tax=Metallosphaera TaxID=41980 RepID=UPI001F05F491|nr:nucleotidyltransferase domain-containing protein [Metallosphaera sedula]MCH1771499.1 nucleotidyltransferase domain-containing protein [Metallosphaera sedula]MCP6728615.1 nucleotidyltransferase domain-containing protein [Metallosphaera sedula]BBL46991.1 DNA polymerase [Metallosphaera sedula]